MVQHARLCIPFRYGKLKTTFLLFQEYHAARDHFTAVTTLIYRLFLSASRRVERYRKKETRTWFEELGDRAGIFKSCSVPGFLPFYHIYHVYCGPGGKLFRMQILDGSDYQENICRRRRRGYPRHPGKIYDCNGYELAYNELAYS